MTTLPANEKIAKLEEYLLGQIRAATYNLEITFNTGRNGDIQQLMEGRKIGLVDVAKLIGLDISTAVNEGLAEAAEYLEKESSQEYPD